MKEGGCNVCLAFGPNSHCHVQVPCDHRYGASCCQNSYNWAPHGRCGGIESLFHSDEAHCHGNVAALWDILEVQCIQMVCRLGKSPCCHAPVDGACGCKHRTSHLPYQPAQHMGEVLLAGTLCPVHPCKLGEQLHAHGIKEHVQPVFVVCAGHIAPHEGRK